MSVGPFPGVPLPCVFAEIRGTRPGRYLSVESFSTYLSKLALFFTNKFSITVQYPYGFPVHSFKRVTHLIACSYASVMYSTVVYMQ